MFSGSTPLSCHHQDGVERATENHSRDTLSPQLPSKVQEVRSTTGVTTETVQFHETVDGKEEEEEVKGEEGEPHQSSQSRKIFSKKYVYLCM